MGTSFGLVDVATVIYRKKNVRNPGEVGKGILECVRVWRLEDHEGHARSEKDNVGGFLLSEDFVFEVSA